jgi:hypothetical protein
MCQPFRSYQRRPVVNLAENWSGDLPIGEGSADTPVLTGAAGGERQVSGVPNLLLGKSYPRTPDETGPRGIPAKTARIGHQADASSAILVLIKIAY